MDPQQPASPLRATYDLMVKDDYDVPASYEEFEKQALTDKSVLPRLHKLYKANNWSAPEDEAEFSALMLEDVKKKPISQETGPTGSLPSGGGAAPEPTAPDQEFQSVPDLAAPPSPIQPAAAVAPGLQEAIPFAPGTAAAPLAANQPNLETGAPGDLRAPATEEADYLSQLPAFAGGPTVEDGKERVAIPNDYTGAVPPGSYQLKLGGEGDRTQYFDRDLSKLVDGKEQTTWEAASRNFGNQIVNMVKGGADYLASADRRLRDSELGKSADMLGEAIGLNGDPNRGQPFQEAADGLEGLKGKVAPFHEKSTFRFANPSTWPMASSNAAALAAPMVLSALLPESKIAGVAQRLLAVGFDGQILEGSVERAKAAGLTGKQADNFILADGAASMLVFKLGGAGLTAAGQKVLQTELGQGIATALKDRTASLSEAELNEVLKKAAQRFATVAKESGVGATSGGILFGTNEVKNIAAERLTNAAVGREAFPNQSPSEMLARVGGAAGEGALIGGLQGAATAIGAPSPALEGAPAAPISEKLYDLRRPTGQVELRGVQIVRWEEGSPTATVRGQDGQGNPVERDVPAGQLFEQDTAQRPAEAPEPPAPEAQPAEVASATVRIRGTNGLSAELDVAGQVRQLIGPDGQVYEPEALYKANPGLQEVVARSLPAPAEAIPDPSVVDATGQPEPLPPIAPEPVTPTPASPALVEPSQVEPPVATAPAPAQPAVDYFRAPTDLPVAEPAAESLVTLSKSQQAINATLDALDNYNKLTTRQKRGKAGSAARAEAAELGRKAGLDVNVKADFSLSVTREGKRVTRFNEYTSTTPAANHTPLAARPEAVRPFLEDVIAAAETSPAVVQGIGVNLRGKALSARELTGAVEDIKAGKNTLRAQLVLDALENAHRQGYVLKSEGTGMMTRRFRVPIADYVGGKPEARQEVPLANNELADLIASEPTLADAIASYTDPTTGDINYAALAEQGSRGALETFFDVPSDVATKVIALANERATNPQPAKPESRASGAAAPLAGGETKGRSQLDGAIERGAGPSSTPSGEVAPLSDTSVPQSKPTLAEQNVAAKQEFTDALAEFRAARKKGNGTAQSSLLGLPAFSAEESAALTKMIGAAVKLGAVKTKQIIARLRTQGLTDDDATDEQIKPLIRQEQERLGLRKTKPARELPANEPEGTAQRASMKRVLADESQPAALREKIRDTGLDKYEPKSVAETEKAVDAYMARNSLSDAYAEAISTTDNLTGDVRTALRVRVLKTVGDQLTQALDKGDTASADAYLEQSYKVAEALAKRGTDAGREINAYKLLATTAPEAVVYRAQKDVAEQRQKGEAKLGKKAPQEARAVRKAKAEALDAALASPSVKAAREKLASKSQPARPAAEAKGYGESNRIFTKQGLAELRQRLKGMAFSAPLPPDLIYLGAYHLEAGTRKFADFAAKMVQELGVRVRPRLPELYEEAKKRFVSQGGSTNGLEGVDAVEAVLRRELADNLADRILERARPARLGAFDPVKQMLDTLTKRVAETIPAGETKPKDAREALAHAFNNRSEYQQVLSESREQVARKIAELKLPEEAKQRMSDALAEFMDQANDRPYAQQQFNRAVRQAEDAVLADLGSSRSSQYDALAKLPEGRYNKELARIQDHVTEGMAASDGAVKELRDAVGAEINQRVLARRQAIRARNGVFDGPPKPPPTPAKRSLSDRAAELLAAHATPEQIAARLAPEAVREGIQDLGRTLDEIARDHLADPAAIGKSLAEQFVERTGIPEADAKAYATAIEAEFSKRIDTARARRLAQLDKRASATPTKRPVASDLEKTRELFTLSPTDDAAILDHLKRVNDLPELTAQDVADLRKLGQAVQAAPEGFQRDEAVEKLLKRQAEVKGVNWAEIGQAMWYANVLSGYKTHVINFTANVIQTGAELGVNTTHAVLTGKGRYATASGKGLLAGLGRGLREARSVLATGRETSREPGKYEVPGILENLSSKNPVSALKYVNRALRAGDVLFSSGLKEMRAYEQAVKFALEDAASDGTPGQDIWARANEKLYNTKQRIAEARQQATDEGLKGNDLERRIYEIAEQSRGADIMDEARVYAPRAVFNGEMEGALGIVANNIQQITQAVDVKGVKPLKFVIPFVRVITNVANAYLDYTPIGAARAAKGSHLFGKEGSSTQREFTREERQKLLIKSVIGGAVMSAAFAASNSDDGEPQLEITGAGTGNPSKDAQLRADGWQPYSFKVSGTWYSYANTPVGAMLAVVGNVNDGQKYRGELLSDDDGALNSLYLGAWRAMQFTKDMTALKSATDFLTALSSRNAVDLTNYGQRLAVGTVKGFAPFSSFATQIFKDYEMLKEQPRKQGRSFGQMLAQDIPIARDSFNNALDALGDPLPVDTDRLFSAPPHREESTQRVWNWLNKNNLFISVPNRNSGGALVLRAHEGKEDAMTDDEYYKFMQYRGAEIKMLLLANMDKLEKLDPKAAKDVLAEIAEGASERAKVKTFFPNGLQK